MSEPKAELEAILDSKESLTFHPMTIGRYALLDAIDSPLIKTKENLTALNTIPSWYVMTSDIDTLKKYNTKNIEQLKEDAFAKAEELTDLNVLTQFIKDFLEYMYGMNILLPEGNEDAKESKKGKKAQTAS